MRRTTDSSLPSLALALASVLGPGCDLPVEPEEFELREGDPGVEGTWPPSGGTLNTAVLNGSTLMRIIPPNAPASCQGSDACITEIEVMSGGQHVLATAATSEQGDLVVVAEGIEYRGATLVDSRWWLDPAHTAYVTITEFAQEQGHFGYQFEHRVVEGASIRPVICEPDEDGDQWAYVVGDVNVDPGTAEISVDHGALAIACASGALGKAISWGFSPWKNGHVHDTKFYQAGLRTVMADYCGDGSSYTVDGTVIQVSNERAGQTFFDPAASTEAVFGPDGALCLSSPRIIGAGAQCSIPTCGSDESVQGMTTQSFRVWTKIPPS